MSVNKETEVIRAWHFTALCKLHGRLVCHSSK